jgi:hypothetical protein
MTEFKRQEVQIEVTFDVIARQVADMHYLNGAALMTALAFHFDVDAQKNWAHGTSGSLPTTQDQLVIKLRECQRLLEECAKLNAYRAASDAPSTR